MKSKICLLGLIASFSLVALTSGCGNKPSTTSLKTKPEHKATVSKNSKSKPKTEDQAKQQPGKQQPTTELPLGSQDSTSLLDQALNPMGKPSKGAPSLGIPGAISAMPGKTVSPGRLPQNAPPKAQQLLAVLQMRYRAAKSVRIEGNASEIVKADGKVVRKDTDEKSMFVFKRPDKFANISSQEQMICDGKTFVRYISTQKRYLKSKLDKKQQQELLQGMVRSQVGVRTMGLVFGLDYASVFSSMSLQRDTKIAGRDVYVLSLQLKEGVAVPKGMKAVQTLWIGKKDLAIYRNRLVAKGIPQAPKGYKGKMPKSVETTTEVSANKCVFDSNIPDSAFVFTPPAGAKPFEDMTKNVLQGKHAADFTFTAADGTKKKLSDLRGQVVILDMWALPMCEKHLPTIQSVYEKNKDSVQLVSICFNSETEAVKKHLTKKGLTFPVVYADKDMSQIIENDYNVIGLPTMYIIDKSGVVRERMLGLPQAKDINARLQKVMGG